MAWGKRRIYMGPMYVPICITQLNIFMHGPVYPGAHGKLPPVPPPLGSPDDHHRAWKESIHAVFSMAAT